MAAEKPKFDEFLCFAVYSASHAIARAYKPLLERFGLTYPQYLVMVILWEGDGETVSGIGARLFLESSTLTPLIKRLEAAGYVRRERDAEDERQVRVYLTKKGQELRGKLADVPERMLEVFGCSEMEMRKLRSEIAALRENVERSIAAPEKTER